MRQYRRHDLLVTPSTYEGFGMVMVEAMSQRLPVVATSVGAAPMLLADGSGGVLVPPRSAEALASAIRALMADPALRRRLGEAGHQRVSAMSWAATAERTVRCYEAACAARRR
jgi:starch synthase